MKKLIKMIISRAPVRISFGGGGTDFASYYERYGGVVVSVTINKYVYTLLQKRYDNRIQLVSADSQLNQTVDDFYSLKLGEGFDIPTAVMKHFNIRYGLTLFLASDIPPGTGLGSSGALCVSMINLINVLEGLGISRKYIAETAYSIGINELSLPIGKQDEYASAYGGLNCIRFNRNDVTVEGIDCKDEILKTLEENTLLFYTGKTRKSSTILSVQNDACKRNDETVIDKLHRLKELALKMKVAIEKGMLDEFGRLLHEGWMIKRKLINGITTDLIDRAYDSACKSGALGGKLTGAGGGGHIMLYCEKQYQKQVKKKMMQFGFREVDIKFENKGVSILGGDTQ